MRWKWIFMPPAAIVAILLIGFIGGELVLQLWNWLLPPLFGWHQITFWQALGILALCRILFGRSGWHRSGRSNFRRRIRERWENMTPEQREKFRHGMRGRCADFGGAATEPKPCVQPRAAPRLERPEGWSDCRNIPTPHTVKVYSSCGFQHRSVCERYCYHGFETFL